MAFKPDVPASAVMTVALLVLGVAGGATSVSVLKWQSAKDARTTAMELTHGDPDRGERAWRQYACGACHAIQGVEEASGKVGPPLKGIGGRALLAGHEPNDPTHLIAWIQHPQAVEPGVGMPELGLSDGQARDLAAYLYTMK